MASVQLSDLAPDVRGVVEAFLAEAAMRGFDLSVVSTLRSCADQGTSGGPVTVGGMVIKRASGCRSWHVWGRAVDVQIKGEPVSMSSSRYRELGALGKQMGLEWGGDFVSNPDPIHFQYPGGLDIKTLCPVPEQCEQALKDAGLPFPPEPTPGGGRTDSGGDPARPTRPAGEILFFFAVGAAAGWIGIRALQKRGAVAR